MPDNATALNHICQTHRACVDDTTTAFVYETATENTPNTLANVLNVKCAPEFPGQILRKQREYS